MYTIRILYIPLFIALFLLLISIIIGISIFSCNDKKYKINISNNQLKERNLEQSNCSNCCSQCYNCNSDDDSDEGSVNNNIDSSDNNSGDFWIFIMEIIIITI